MSLSRSRSRLEGVQAGPRGARLVVLLEQEIPALSGRRVAIDPSAFSAGDEVLILETSLREGLARGQIATYERPTEAPDPGSKQASPASIPPP